MLVFAVTVGLAVGLARTPLPADTGSDTVTAAADAAIGDGFEMHHL